MRIRIAAVGVAVVCVAMLATGDAAAQGIGVPGAPNQRIGGMRGGSGSPAGSSVPMMSRLGPSRPGPALGQAAGPTNRYSSRFSSATVRAGARGAAGMNGGSMSQAVKAQAKNAGRGGLGF